jgi:hypothetical protein
MRVGLGGVLGGDVLCYQTGTQAHMVWIYDDYDIYARARRDDGDHAALYDCGIYRAGHRALTDARNHLRPRVSPR